MVESRISGNPFIATAQGARPAKRSREAEASQSAEPRYSPRARLNAIPDDDTLLSMIDRALQALSRGLRWDRGAILNLLV